MHHSTLGWCSGWKGNTYFSRLFFFMLKYLTNLNSFVYFEGRLPLNISSYCQTTFIKSYNWIAPLRSLNPTNVQAEIQVKASRQMSTLCLEISGRTWTHQTQKLSLRGLIYQVASLRSKQSSEVLSTTLTEAAARGIKWWRVDPGRAPSLKINHQLQRHIWSAQSAKAYNWATPASGQFQSSGQQPVRLLHLHFWVLASCGAPWSWLFDPEWLTHLLDVWLLDCIQIMFAILNLCSV